MVASSTECGLYLARASSARWATCDRGQTCSAPPVRRRAGAVAAGTASGPSPWLFRLEWWAGRAGVGRLCFSTWTGGSPSVLRPPASHTTSRWSSGGPASSTLSWKRCSYRRAPPMEGTCPGPSPVSTRAGHAWTTTSSRTYPRRRGGPRAGPRQTPLGPPCATCRYSGRRCWGLTLASCCQRPSALRPTSTARGISLVVQAGTPMCTDAVQLSGGRDGWGTRRHARPFGCRHAVLSQYSTTVQHACVPHSEVCV
mmetsp:Transcript_7018/g.20747  ORF Transcript_7018/g.20747 Transcript_7018/m.20747 type:complete len:255 (+) Transcript_7018:939-1703(+)